jgi:hypothetical protein
MKKAIATQLRKLAQETVPLLVQMNEFDKKAWANKPQRKTSGRELLECGYKPQPGEVLKPTAGYICSIPPLINHYDNLKKAYKAEGKYGIKKYMEWVNSVVQLQKAIDAAKLEEVPIEEVPVKGDDNE